MPRKSKIDPNDWLEGGPLEDDSDVVTTAAGIVVNKSRLCQIMGLAPMTVDRAFKEGAPVIAKGAKKLGWQINTADFVGWYVRYKVGEVEGEGNEGGVSFDQAKTRAMLAQAEQREMDNKRKRAETLTIDEAVQLYREETSNVRSQLLTVPGRLAQALSAETNPTIIESIIADEINLVLSNITGDARSKWTGENDGHFDDDHSDNPSDSET